MTLETNHNTLIAAARGSALSRAQVQEVCTLMRVSHPEFAIECLYVDTIGDKDQQTSLRFLDKTDFFTREIDHLLLAGDCRIAIHSAKDLPEPLPSGIVLAALTHGVDSSDALVLRSGDSLMSLPSGALIATSSFRREEVVKELRSDLAFVDIRGTIGQRLEKLKKKDVDGVVVAEAALIRLGLVNLNRMRLPGDTAPLQGQLAIVCRSGDGDMLELFKCIDSRLCFI